MYSRNLVRSHIPNKFPGSIMSRRRRRGLGSNRVLRHAARPSEVDLPTTPRTAGTLNARDGAL